MAEIINMAERKASPEELAALEGKLPYKPTYCNFSAWDEAGDPPKREWAIEHWIGMGYVTLLAGQGGMGKSLIAQQLGTALSIGKSHIGSVPQPRPVLMWAGEDDDDELNRRQTAICRKFDISRKVLQGHFYLESMADTDCCLFDFIQGGTHKTSMLSILREQVGDLKAEVVILDNIARVFGANENDRHHVSTFMACLAWAMNPSRAACLLLGHVSKALGSEYSGSTAWENAVRGRLWFTNKLPDKQQDSDEYGPQTDLRYLAKRKVNYTSLDLCTLRYTEGAYDIVESPEKSQLVSSIMRERAARVVIESLRLMLERNVYCSDSTSSPGYLPRLILESSLNEGLTRRDLAVALRQAIIDGFIKIGKTTHQYPYNRNYKTGLVLP